MAPTSECGWGSRSVVRHVGHAPLFQAFPLAAMPEAPPAVPRRASCQEPGVYYRLMGSVLPQLGRDTQTQRL
jgi:hypothetical protein